MIDQQNKQLKHKISDDGWGKQRGRFILSNIIVYISGESLLSTQFSFYSQRTITNITNQEANINIFSKCNFMPFNSEWGGGLFLHMTHTPKHT